MLDQFQTVEVAHLLSKSSLLSFLYTHNKSPKSKNKKYNFLCEMVLRRSPPGANSFWIDHAFTSNTHLSAFRMDDFTQDTMYNKRACQTIFSMYTYRPAIYQKSQSQLSKEMCEKHPKGSDKTSCFYITLTKVLSHYTNSQEYITPSTGKRFRLAYSNSTTYQYNREKAARDSVRHSRLKHDTKTSGIYIPLLF